MTPTDVAKRLGLSPPQVRWLIRAGKIEAKRVPSHRNQVKYEYDITEGEVRRQIRLRQPSKTYRP